jgi:TPR repeat protein
MGLNAGDGVMHQSDLLHGVHVEGPLATNQSESKSTRESKINSENVISSGSESDSREGTNGKKKKKRSKKEKNGKKSKKKGRMEASGDASEVPRARRWSWVLWFLDSDTCEDHGYSWFSECAEAGNPTCELLIANKVSQRPNPPSDPTSEIVGWNMRAAEHGHPGALIKMARAYLKSIPSFLDFDLEKAQSMYQRAADESQDPDAYFGLAQIRLASAGSNADLAVVIKYLEEAAKGGHAFAMFNLGMAHLYGYVGGKRDPDLAGAWFAQSGLPEGLFAKSMHARSVSDEVGAVRFEARAKALGYGSQWRKQAREHTGSGGAGGVDLNMPWPPLPDGQRPPTW